MSDKYASIYGEHIGTMTYEHGDLGFSENDI